MGLHIPPALHHRRFRLLWLGLAISVAGSQMQMWALLWHIRDLTDQPIALGGIGLARLIPVIIFSLIGGAVADTLDRRTIIFITQSAMALVALCLAILTLMGTITIWSIYLLTAIQAMASAFDMPARQSMVPNLVPAEDLPNAFSMQSMAFELGAIVGPALSGMVIGYWGQAYVYLINAISFLAVIIALIMIGRVPQKPREAGQRVISLKAIGQGVKFIYTQPMILSTMVLDFFATFFSSANTLLPFFARDILKVGPVAYGWLSAAQSIGATSAALVISQVNQIRKQGPIFLISVIIFGLATILFGVSKTIVLAMIALIIIGAADTVSMIIRNTIRQLQTPDEMRGRMTSINQIFFMGGPQLGEVEAGIVAQLFGVPIAIVTGGIGCILAVVLISRKWPQIMEYNGDEPIKAGAAAD